MRSASTTGPLAEASALGGTTAQIGAAQVAKASFSGMRLLHHLDDLLDPGLAARPVALDRRERPAPLERAELVEVLALDEDAVLERSRIGTAPFQELPRGLRIIANVGSLGEHVIPADPVDDRAVQSARVAGGLELFDVALDPIEPGGGGRDDYAGPLVSDLDFSEDRGHWLALSEETRERLLWTLAAFYVETVRNIPLFIIVVFSYLALALVTFGILWRFKVPEPIVVAAVAWQGIATV